MLADLGQRVLAVADEVFRELLVVGQTADEVVGHGGDGVVSAEAGVEGGRGGGRLGVGGECGAADSEGEDGEERDGAGFRAMRTS